MIGQGIRPEGYDPVADVQSPAETAERIAHIRSVLKTSVDYMPGHADFIAEHCAAP